MRRWVRLGRWGNWARVGERAPSLAHHTVCALPAPSQNTTCRYPVCHGRLGSRQLAPVHHRLYFPRMITPIAGAQMTTPSKLPLSGSRVRSTFDPVKYCSWRQEPFQTQQPLKATNNLQTIRHSVRQQHLHTLENQLGRGMSGDPTTHQQGAAKGVLNDQSFWAYLSTFLIIIPQCCP